MVEVDHRFEATQAPVLVAEYHRGESGLRVDSPHVVEIHTLEVPLMPLIPLSIELPGFDGPLFPVVTVFRSSIKNESPVDIGVLHGPSLGDVSLEQLQVVPPAGYRDTGMSSIVGINQHDLSGDAEHADFPFPVVPDSDDHNDRIFPDPRFASNTVFPRSFGHPTSDWRPQDS